MSHVCTHWREVALNTPILWNRPVLDIPNLGFEMLQRSKDGPLIIHASLPDDEAGGVVLKAMEHISRVVDIHLEGYSKELSAVLDNAIHPAPRLRKLRLCANPDAGFSSLRLPLTSVDDRTLFDASTPCLTTLILDGCHISRAASLLKNLTALQLRIPQAARPGMSQCIEILQDTPMLEVLVLICYAESGPWIDGHEQRLTSESGQTVSLHRLQSVHLSADVTGVVQFLNRVRYPATNIFSLRSSFQETRELFSMFSALGSMFSRIISSPLQPEVGITQAQASIKSLSCMPGDYFYLLSAWTCDEREVPTTEWSPWEPEGIPPHLRLYFYFSDNRHPWFTAGEPVSVDGTSMQPILESLIPSLAKLETLELESVPDRLSPHLFVRCFSSLPRLHTVVFFQGAAELFLITLGLPNNTSAESSPPIFATLETLEFRDVEFNSYVQEGVPARLAIFASGFATVSGSKTILDALLDVLEYRRQAGAEIASVRLRDGFKTPRHIVGKIEKAVQCVEQYSPPMFSH
ncbi:hypothetical protein AAF712_001945 [Marasmius tenuissimus]|uniref:F-box domain-containing protein n=1 Tax=Marasmius tenuissimus TaxID=585030 RepID=A0ABR3ABI0_9AGAR